MDNLWHVQPERVAGEWEARRIFLDHGYVDGPRRVGVTHNRRGDRLFFLTYSDAERAAAALNAAPVQLGMGL